MTQCWMSDANPCITESRALSSECPPQATSPSPPRRPQATPGSDVTDIVRDTAALVTCCVITGNNMTHCIRHIFAECTISPRMTVRKQIVGKILEFRKLRQKLFSATFIFRLVSWAGQLNRAGLFLRWTDSNWSITGGSILLWCEDLINCPKEKMEMRDYQSLILRLYMLFNSFGPYLTKRYILTKPDADRAENMLDWPPHLG